MARLRGWTLGKTKAVVVELRQQRRSPPSVVDLMMVAWLADDDASGEPRESAEGRAEL